jgi:hypothetical protein
MTTFALPVTLVKKGEQTTALVLHFRKKAADLHEDHDDVDRRTERQSRKHGSISFGSS